VPESCAVAAESINKPVVCKPWFVYLVRAANGSLYCGISDDPVRRFAAHQSGKGARFFCSSPAVALVYVEQHVSKGEALRHERLIKKLRKTAKEVLAASYKGVPVQVSINERDVVSST